MLPLQSSLHSACRENVSRFSLSFSEIVKVRTVLQPPAVMVTDTSPVHKPVTDDAVLPVLHRYCGTNVAVDDMVIIPEHCAAQFTFTWLAVTTGPAVLSTVITRVSEHPAPF
jgi:hypothetical protein